MKITEVLVHCCRLPLTPLERGGLAPYQLSYRLATHADRYFVEVKTDEGIVSWGEGELTISPQTIASFYQNDLAGLIGFDACEINQVRSYFKQTTFKKYLNEQVFLAPVEMACWDILGKSVGLSVSQLLGGAVRERLPVAFIVGVLPQEQLLKSIAGGYERGYRTFKLKGGNNFREDAVRIQILSKEFPDAEFRLDPNQAWSLGDCVRFVEMVRGCPVQYLEQPIRIQSLEEAARLRARSPIPLALNDDCYGPWTLDAIVRSNAADVAIVDLEPLGGISGLVRAAHFAETANLALTHHTGFDFGVKTAAVAQVAAVMPIFRLPLDCTYMSQDDDVLTERLQIENAELLVPTGPGLGVEVDREKLERYRITSL